MSGVEVKGLRQAGENLLALKGMVRLQIGREALKQGALVINSAVKQATYTTFHRVTGFVQSGFGVRVGQSLKGEVLSAVVVQYPQSMAGTSPMARLVQQHHTPKTRHGSVSLTNVAFYWRFLELGTKGRHAARTPAFSREGRIARNKRQSRALAKYSASSSLGDISPRPWVGPAFNSTKQAAIDKFAATTRQLTEQAINAMPK